MVRQQSCNELIISPNSELHSRLIHGLSQFEI
jgi:hypothetical protein